MDEVGLSVYVNARCGEVYLSNQGTLIFVCSLCNESFKGYGIYLEHIITEHDLPVYSVEDVYTNTQADIEAEAMETVEVINVENPFENFEEDIIQLDSSTNTELDLDTRLSIETLTDNFGSQDGSLNDEEDFLKESDIISETKNEQLSNTDKNPSSTERADGKNKKRYRSEYPSQGLFNCPVCQLSIKGKSNLEKHILRHDDENKRFQCSYCPKRFHVKFELKQHEASHTGDRPYLCTICGRRFVSTGKLNEHTNMIHEHIRNKSCEVCNKTFYSNKYLRRHMMTHTTERCHKCDICGSAFKVRKTLVAHMKLHENKREYQCQFCSAQFNQRPALHSHIKTRHKPVTQVVDSETDALDYL